MSYACIIVSDSCLRESMYAVASYFDVPVCSNIGNVSDAGLEGHLCVNLLVCPHVLLSSRFIPCMKRWVCCSNASRSLPEGN